MKKALVRANKVVYLHHIHHEKVNQKPQMTAVATAAVWKWVFLIIQLFLHLLKMLQLKMERTCHQYLPSTFPLLVLFWWVLLRLSRKPDYFHNASFFWPSATSEQHQINQTWTTIVEAIFNTVSDFFSIWYRWSRDIPSSLPLLDNVGLILGMDFRNMQHSEGFKLK